MCSSLRSFMVCSQSLLPKLENLQYYYSDNIRGHYCPSDILGKEREDQPVDCTVEHYVGCILQSKSDKPGYDSNRIRTTRNDQSLVRGIVDIAEDGSRIFMESERPVLWDLGESSSWRPLGNALSLLDRMVCLSINDMGKRACQVYKEK